MIPRDWMLVVEGHREMNEGSEPGSSAPSLEEYHKLVEEYG